MFPLT
jgi:hypothetical protein